MGTVVFGSGILMYHTANNKAEMARPIIKTENFMAQPITDMKDLESNKNDMKTKMELMIMKIQVSKCEIKLFVQQLLKFTIIKINM